MDYVIGSVAALISGNVTPNRPKLVRRALTPTKHQASPNVTPKSGLVEDRSIFLSPTQQKKKAIVKKSPKRIFQNPDLDVTEDCEGNSSLASPKADKVKKHLKEKLDADDMGKKKSFTTKSSHKLDNPETPKKKKKVNSESNVTESDRIGVNNDYTKTEPVEITNVIESNAKTPKKKQRKSVTDIQTKDTEVAHTHGPNQDDSISNNITTSEGTSTTQPNNQETKKSKKRKKKNKKPLNEPKNAETNTIEDSPKNSEPQNSKKNKNRKKKSKHSKSITEDITPQESGKMDVDNKSESDSEDSKTTNIPNPNAITEKESDSEHDSDDEIESENEQENEKILTNENKPEESSDEEEPESSSKKKEQSKEKGKEVAKTEDEIKRTLFVGNVPFDKKCKKNIKKIFSKYGQIATIRIRTIPVKDARVTPKLAIIKNELHPERSTVNVYVKYTDPASVNKALAENNTVLEGNHLRVSRSDSTGAEHDPRCAVFVGNLPFAVEDDTLRSKFENCGEITSVRIIRDKKTNAGKGFGYVNFATKDGVELALALSEEDLTIKNRILRVKRCTLQRPGGGKPGDGKRGHQGQGGGSRDHQGQAGKWGNQGQGGGNRGSQGQTGKWGNQGQGGGNRGGSGQGGNRGGPGQGGNRGGPGQGGNRGGPGQGGNRGGPGQGGNRGGPGQGGNRGSPGQWGNRGGPGQGGSRGGPGQGGNRGGPGQGGSRGGPGQMGKWGNPGQTDEGAARRLMNKRKQQEGASEGPPNKKQKDVNQPTKEKKPRKEFVGITAEKKKKQKFDKGLKRKKVLSEILTKKS